MSRTPDQVRRHARLLESGMCVTCAAAPAAPTITKCAACMEKQRDAYYKLRATGRCSSCGQQAIPGKTLCADHARLLKVRSSAIRADRLAAGVCPVCGKPRDTHRQNCQHCTDIVNASKARARARKEQKS